MTATDFLTALGNCLGRSFDEGERLAVAVSGGADSLALLLLASKSLPGRVTALTVDHGFRVESAQEAQDVAQICRSIGVPHRTLVAIGLKDGANLQARAREARYGAMAQCCSVNRIGLLATAHHADDQAETILMRLARGAGMTGAAGIRACRPLTPSLLLVRPLLGWRKQMLADHVRAAGIVPAEDPSNQDDRFDRTRARRLLVENDWLSIDGIAASVRHLAQESAALDWVAELAWKGRAEQSGDGWSVDVEGLPLALCYRLVLRAITQMGCDTPRGSAVERLIESLSVGKTSTLGGIQVRAGRPWFYSRAASRRSVRSN